MFCLLIQTLLNALWENPSNPYVSTQDYDHDVVIYLRETHVVEPHPQNTEQLRLVAYHEPLPDTHTVRPAAYR